MDNLADNSRRIFHKIHVKQKDCKEATYRMINSLSTEYLNLDKDYFVGKICADLGCGSAAVGTVNMLKMKAKFVYLSDVNESFFESAKGILNSNVEFHNRWQTDVADATKKLPYEDKSMDFVLAQGFFQHIENELNVLSEINRILKPRGKAYVDINGKGGLIGNFVMKTMREEYIENKSFKDYIEKDLSVGSLKKIICGMKESIEKDNSTPYKNCLKFLDSLSDLIDEDLILTIEDRLFAPIYRQTSENDFIDKLKRSGFSEWYRVSRKPSYQNIRKILAPIYESYDSQLAKILFGDGGVMNFVITK